MMRRFVVPVVGGVLFAFTYVTAVLTSRGQRLENDALSAATVPHGEPLVLAFVSVPDLFFGLVAVVTIALVRRRRDAALRAFLVLALSNLATQLFKYRLLSRPDLSDLLKDNTFPSGHTTAYLSVMLAFLIVVPTRFRPVVSVFGAVVTAAAAVELMNYGWHRLSDIVGAVLLVLTIASLTVAFIRPSVATTAPGRQGRIGARLLVIAGIAALLFGAVFTIESRFADGSRDRLLLVGTEGFAAAAVCAAFLAMGWVLARPRAEVVPGLASRPVRIPRRTR
jgi:membrane-associated phospholipid phosphatase